VLQELNSKFAIPSVIEFVPGNGGLIKAVLTTPLASGEVYLHGAHVTA
jgi:glucose-6-phosphate 1-epimerase